MLNKMHMTSLKTTKVSGPFGVGENRVLFIYNAEIIMLMSKFLHIKNNNNKLSYIN